MLAIGNDYGAGSFGNSIPTYSTLKVGESSLPSSSSARDAFINSAKEIEKAKEKTDFWEVLGLIAIPAIVVTIAVLLRKKSNALKKIISKIRNKPAATLAKPKFVETQTPYLPSVTFNETPKLSLADSISINRQTRAKAKIERQTARAQAKAKKDEIKTKAKEERAKAKAEAKTTAEAKKQAKILAEEKQAKAEARAKFKEAEARAKAKQEAERIKNERRENRETVKLLDNYLKKDEKAQIHHEKFVIKRQNIEAKKEKAGLLKKIHNWVENKAQAMADKKETIVKKQESDVPARAIIEKQRSKAKEDKNIKRLTRFIHEI